MFSSTFFQINQTCNIHFYPRHLVKCWWPARENRGTFVAHEGAVYWCYLVARYKKNQTGLAVVRFIIVVQTENILKSAAFQPRCVIFCDCLLKFKVRTPLPIWAFDLPHKLFLCNGDLYLRSLLVCLEKHGVLCQKSSFQIVVRSRLFPSEESRFIYGPVNC